MNQFVVIFVPCGEELAGVEARQHQRREPKDDAVETPSTDSLHAARDAERLPLWRWFTFEKGP
jgi:hypothetical protein